MPTRDTRLYDLIKSHLEALGGGDHADRCATRRALHDALPDGTAVLHPGRIIIKRPGGRVEILPVVASQTDTLY